MVKFKLKDVTWNQRKELSKALEAAGKTPVSIAKEAAKTRSVSMPIDFIELAFKYGIEDFDDVEKLNDLSEVDLQEGAALVYTNVFFKPAIEKKS